MGVYVSGLNVHPGKSMKAIPVPETQVTRAGFRDDRLAMLVYADGPNKGVFVSQRDRGAEKLGQVFASVARGFGPEPHVNLPYAHCTFIKPDGEKWDERITLHDDQLMDIRIFANDCAGYNVGDKDGFFSRYLGFPVSLVLYDPERPREVDKTYGRMGDVVNFADGYPVLITSEPSLASLQAHLPHGTNNKIGMDRFRSNLVLDGNIAWEEDVMHHIRVGEVELEIVKPCARCTIPTVDPETGIPDPLGEPLETLKKYRMGVGKRLVGAFFGQNAIPRKGGTIHLGDKVEILSTQPIHKALTKAKIGYGLQSPLFG